MFPDVRSVVMEAFFNNELKKLATFHWSPDTGVSVVLTTSDPESRDLVLATVNRGVESPDRMSIVEMSDGQSFMRALLSAGNAYIHFNDATVYPQSTPAPTMRERETYELLRGGRLVLPMPDAKLQKGSKVETTFITAKVADRTCVVAFSSSATLGVALGNNMSWITLTEQVGRRLSAADRHVLVDPHTDDPVVLLSHLLFPIEGRL